MSDEIENDTIAEQESTTPPGERVSKNYPPNTNRQRQAPRAAAPGTDKPKDAPKEKHVQKVIQGEAVQRKKGIGSKFRSIFTADDMHNVGQFIMFEVIVPAIKNMVSDAVSQGVERSLFGDSSRRSSPGRAQTRQYTAYNTYSRPGPAASSPVGRAGESDGPRMSSRGRSVHDFDDIVLESRGDADAVLDTLVELVRTYEVATVADLYEAVGISGSFTDNKWGWTSLAGAGVTRARNGYLLDLPRPTAIE